MKAFFGNIWRIVFCAFVFAFGLIASRVALHALGVSPPRMPGQADESTAIYYLISGSLLLSLAMFPVVRKTSGAFLTRFLTIFVFFFACFGISTSLESAIYSSVGGYDLMTIILLTPCLLFAFAATLLTNSKRGAETFQQKWTRFWQNKTRMDWARRMLGALLAFPIIYLAFGILASPFVVKYYEGLDYGLRIPGMGVILGVQLLRSALFLLVTLPVMISWTGTKTQLILALGAAHWATVFGYDVVLAYQLPPGLVLTHAVEILLDSLVYSWVFVKLLHPKR